VSSLFINYFKFDTVGLDVRNPEILSSTASGSGHDLKLAETLEYNSCRQVPYLIFDYSFLSLLPWCVWKGWRFGLREVSAMDIDQLRECSCTESRCLEGEKMHACRYAYQGARDSSLGMACVFVRMCMNVGPCADTLASLALPYICNSL